MSPSLLRSHGGSYRSAVEELFLVAAVGGRSAAEWADDELDRRVVRGIVAEVIRGACTAQEPCATA